MRNLIFLAALLVATAPAALGQVRAHARARELGVAPGLLATGAFNAITDVPGVAVGHATVREGDSIRTGVTAILPHRGNLFH